MNDQDLPESVRMGRRLTGMSANQATLPMAGSIFKFARRGQPDPGFNYEHLTYKHQGHYYRLTDVAGKVVKKIIA
jgi:hypothetical protein